MKWHPACGRAGISLPEALVALVLGMLVVHLGLNTLQRIKSAQVRLAVRSDALVALRVGRYVLRRELRRARPGRDWVLDRDSLSLRAFRGTAFVCPNDSATVELTVSYSGDRRPDPSKDSVLLFTREGEWEVRALAAVGSAPTSCGPVGTGSLATWRLDEAAPPGTVLARLFERGSYHLSGSALRYRRGLSGRQPLTPEIWSTATGWTRSGARVGLELFPRDADAGQPWSGFLSWVD